jgi:hypothetical protein
MATICDPLFSKRSAKHIYTNRYAHNNGGIVGCSVLCGSIQRLYLESLNTPVTFQAIWPIAKSFTKRDRPKAPSAIHDSLGPISYPSRMAKIKCILNLNHVSDNWKTYCNSLFVIIKYCDYSEINQVTNLNPVLVMQHPITCDNALLQEHLKLFPLLLRNDVQKLTPVSVTPQKLNQL